MRLGNHNIIDALYELDPRNYSIRTNNYKNIASHYKNIFGNNWISEYTYYETISKLSLPTHTNRNYTIECIKGALTDYFDILDSGYARYCQNNGIPMPTPIRVNIETSEEIDAYADEIDVCEDFSYWTENMSNCISNKENYCLRKSSILEKYIQITILLLPEKLKKEYKMNTLSMYGCIEDCTENSSILIIWT